MTTAIIIQRYYYQRGEFNAARGNIIPIIIIYNNCENHYVIIELSSRFRFKSTREKLSLHIYYTL